MGKKQVILENFDFFGPTSWIIEPESISGIVQQSENVEQVNDRTYALTTDMDGNVFNCAVLQFTNTEDGTLIPPTSIRNSPGVFNGIYVHESPDGFYFIKLRANSNKKDEYIGFEIWLQEGMAYRWSYEVITLDSKKVGVNNLLLEKMGIEVR